MRDIVLSYIKARKFTNYSASDELPFNNSGIEMYLKNPKKIYVDVDQISNEVFIAAMNANVNSETTTIRVFFSNDSKRLPNDYSTVTDYLLTAKDLISSPEHFQRAVNMETEQIQDLLVTTVEYQFTKLLLT